LLQPLPLLLGLLQGLHRLALGLVPLTQLASQRAKEQELRAALRDIRTAIDAYKKATDENRVEKKADETGYPPDLEVLAKVVDRAVAPGELVPAMLPAWRRVRARNASYPLIVPDPSGGVPGLLFARPQPRDLARIRHFESEEYAGRVVPVLHADGQWHRAELVLAIPGVLEASDEPWHLEGWQAGEKTAFLLACDIWMADCADFQPA